MYFRKTIDTERLRPRFVLFVPHCFLSGGQNFEVVDILFIRDPGFTSVFWVVISEHDG